MTAPVDLDRVRDLVTAVAGVARVNGRGANGVSADSRELEVHVIARYGTVLPELADRLDAELAPLLAGRTLTVVVDDVAGDDEPDPDDGADTDQPAIGTTAHAPAIEAPAAPVAELEAAVRDRAPDDGESARP